MREGDYLDVSQPVSQPARQPPHPAWEMVRQTQSDRMECQEINTRQQETALHHWDSILTINQHCVGLADHFSQLKFQNIRFGCV